MPVLETLKFQLEKNRLSHAYLILNDFKIEDLIKLFKVHLADLLVIDDSPIKINQIRELTHWNSLKPHSSPIKLAVILNTEDLTLEAANALLKILEEPSANTLVILKAERKEKILPTILSRCQIIKNEYHRLKEKPTSYRSIEEISRLSIKERFDFAADIIEEGNIAGILNEWEANFRSELKAGKDVLAILKRISRDRSLLKSNISLKLLLENLLLNF